MSIGAGELNRLIAIEGRTGATDEANQEIDDWSVVPGLGALWARPMTPNGMSTIGGGATGVPAAMSRYSWRIRYRPVGIDVGMRVNYKGQLFDIVDIKHDLDRRDWTDLVCTTGANNG